MNPPGISLLTFNIGNPSPERAQRQLGWLASRDEQILVLTETKASAGCKLLADAFTSAGYTVCFPQPGHGEYGTSTYYDGMESLRDRQREVLKLIGTGKSNVEIAEELSCSLNTVKRHVTAVLQKLRVPNRTRAAMMANQSDL